MPNPALLAALVSGVAGLAGQGMASWTNFLMQKNANKTNIQLANEQYARQRADIAAMNAYNSPASQVVRLRAAGLSPAMMYGGSGASVAGEQSSVPSYERASVKAPEFDAGAIASTMADMAKLPTEIVEKNAHASYLNKQAEKLSVDIDFALKNNPQLLEKARLDIESARQNIDNLRAEYELKVANTKLADINLKKVAQEIKVSETDLMIMLAKFPHELMNLKADAALKWSQKNKNDESVKQMWATIYEVVRHNKEMEYQYGMDSRRRANVGYENIFWNHDYHDFDDDEANFGGAMAIIVSVLGALSKGKFSN